LAGMGGPRYWWGKLSYIANL